MQAQGGVLDFMWLKASAYPGLAGSGSLCAPPTWAFSQFHSGLLEVIAYVHVFAWQVTVLGELVTALAWVPCARGLTAALAVGYASGAGSVVSYNSQEKG